MKQIKIKISGSDLEVEVFMAITHSVPQQFIGGGSVSEYNRLSKPNWVLGTI